MVCVCVCFLFCVMYTKSSGAQIEMFDDIFHLQLLSQGFFYFFFWFLIRVKDKQVCL